MKRIIRLFAAALAITLVGLSLCSCRQLEEKRANRAYYTDDKKDTILFRDETYREIDFGEDISLVSPEYSDYYYDNNGMSYDAAESDLPILLTGDSMLVFHDSDLLCVYRDDETNDDDEVYVYSAAHYYARGSMYDTLTQAIKNNDFSFYCIEREYEELEDYYGATGVYLPYEYELVDSKVTDAINNALKTPYDDRVKLIDISDKQKKVISVQSCDENMLLTDGTMQIVQDDDKYYVYKYSYHNEFRVYPIDKKDYDTIKQFFFENENLIEYTNEYPYVDNPYE